MRGRQVEIGELESVEVPYVQEGLAPDAAEVEAAERGRQERAEIEMPVHWAAELFPMLEEEELEALAADIKANGLIEPLVRTVEGVLIDGRNRFAACRRVGVEPRFVELNGEDAAGYILSRNVGRRHQSKAELALLALKIINEPPGDQTDPNIMFETDPRLGITEVGWTAQMERLIPLGAMTVRRACFLYRWAPDLLPRVFGRTVSMKDALEIAQQRQAEATSDDAKLSWIAEREPELADQVRDQSLTLAGALAEAQEREKQRRAREAQAKQRLDLLNNQFDQALRFFDPLGMDPAEMVAEWLSLPAGGIDRARTALASLKLYLDQKGV